MIRSPPTSSIWLEGETEGDSVKYKIRKRGKER